jgi:5'-nucleotidase
MNILLTNDDGILSEGLYAMYKALKSLGTVTVVAPDGERSAISQAITLAEPIFSKEIYKKKKFYGTAISGTPADCVKFAIGVVLKKKPDLIVSGINLGPNDGCSVFYSGTAAGAREGALSGIPSIAISLATFLKPDFRYAAQVGAQYAKKILEEKLSRKSFLNINVPAVSRSLIKGIKITKQCRIPIHGKFKKLKDPEQRDYYWLSGREPATKKDLSYDTYALAHNYVTVTPISTDSTDQSYYEANKDA